MTDALHPFSFEHQPVRGFWVRLDNTWHDSVRRHSYPPVVAEHLGELQLASAILAHSIKRQGLLTLQATGDGPLSTLMAECRDQQGLRGIARIRDLPALTSAGTPLPALLPELMGQGNLAITIRPDQGQSYQGVVPLVGARIGPCLESYFMQSEQLPTRLWLAARDGKAAGIMIQRLPGQAGSGGDDDDGWRRLGLLGDTLSNDELLTLPVAEILTRLFHDDAVRVQPPRPLAFRCSCNRERTADALRLMGEPEVRQILAEDGLVTVDCQFCGEQYGYGDDAVEILFQTP